MKNRILSNSIRTIKKTFPRFLSLIVMSLLGVMVFVGLLATSPDMLITLDNYYDEKNVYDIKILSTMGLIEEDITTLKKFNNVKEVEGIYLTDVLLSSDENEYVLNISSIPKKINLIELVEGKLPQNEQEIVIEENFLEKTKYKLGDTIKLDSKNLNQKEFKIVGTIISPLYFNQTNLSQTRGTSSLGAGMVNYYSYVIDSTFTTDYYTNIYITIDDAKERVTSKEEYLELVNNITSQLENIKVNQENNRYQKIYNETLNEIEKNETEANKELNNVKKKLDLAKKKLDSSKKTLDSTKKQLKTFKEELDKGYKNLITGKKEYEKALKNNGIKEIEISKNIKLLKTNISNLEQLLASLDQSSQEYVVYINQLDTLKNQLKSLEILESTKKNLDKGITYINKCLNNDNSWVKRVGLVLLLDYYINDKYIDIVLTLSNNIKSDEYYVKMANSWLISICYIKYPDKTKIFLNNTKIDNWTYNKAISKICDSKRIDKDTKTKLRSKLKH